MLTNLNNEKVSTQIFKNFDVAIVGAGAAGITLTKELSSFGKNVALIEAGDYEYTDESQEIYIAKTIGDQYFDLDVARLRHFGGTTNHWEVGADHLKKKILKEDISVKNINGQ